jgi:GMP synthase-like glutamine amidotransferase
MRLHVLQHVPFEGPVVIADWAASRCGTITRTRLFDGEALPGIETFDWLVVMGGPMGVHDEAKHPWLRGEKAFLRRAIEAGKTVVGVCLGAQLIADALGARVYRGPRHEIGWLPIEFTAEAVAPDLFPTLPRETIVFQWHGDTFDIPEGAVKLARSEAVENQAFLYDGRVLALQFHLEVTRGSVAALTEACADEIVPDRCVQDATTMLAAGDGEYERMHGMLDAMLERLKG